MYTSSSILARTFSDTKQFTGNPEINFCTLRNGLYDLCVIDDTTALRPSPTLDEQHAEDGRLAGWVIALIVILALSIVCCGGYAIAVLCFGVANCFKDQDNNNGKEFQNKIYMDGGRGPTDFERRLAIMDDRSRKSERRLAVTQGERQAHHASTFCEDPLNDPSFQDSFTINSFKRSRPSRDPTMYIPGQEGRPDPMDSRHSSFRTTGSTGSRRYYSEEPPVKPKRDPTMYVNGKASMDYPPTTYILKTNKTVDYENECSDDDDDYDYRRGERDDWGGASSNKFNQDRGPDKYQHGRGSSAGRSAFSSPNSTRSITNQQSSVYSG